MEHFTYGGLTNFGAISSEIQILVERLYQAVFAQNDLNLVDRLCHATKNCMPDSAACSKIMNNCAGVLK